MFVTNCLFLIARKGGGQLTGQNGEDGKEALNGGNKK